MNWWLKQDHILTPPGNTPSSLEPPNGLVGLNLLLESAQVPMARGLLSILKVSLSVHTLANQATSNNIGDTFECIFKYAEHHYAQQLL